MSERACAIILLGPPGSGKTTLARSLSRRGSIAIIEVGVLLVREARKPTPLGRRISKYTNSGMLAPLHLVEPIISHEVKAVRDGTILFDGIPRARGQIHPFFQLLGRHNLRLCAVIVLHLELQTALRRLSRRRVCSRCGRLYNVPVDSLKLPNSCHYCGGRLIRRVDDQEHVIRKRFIRFKRQALPVINFFKTKSASLVFEVNGAVSRQRQTEATWRHLQAVLRQPHGFRVTNRDPTKPGIPRARRRAE